VKKDALLVPNLSWLLISTFKLNGENQRLNNSQTYHFGNSLQVTSGLNYNLFVGWPIDVFVFGRYRYQPPDLINDVSLPGSGGEWVSLLQGVNFNISPNFSARASFQLPVYRALKGVQLTTSYRTGFSVFYNLALSKDQEFKPNQ
jgi:hypothetical protein